MILLTGMFFLCSIIYACIGTTIYRNDYKNRLNKLFFVCCINLSIWAFVFALINHVTDVETAILLRTYSAFFWGSFYSMMLHFFIVLCNKDKYLKNTMYYILIYLPSLITIYINVYVKPITAAEIVPINLGWAFINTDGGFIYNQFHSIYCITYIILSVGLLWNWSKNTKIKREKYQARIIIFSLVLVTLVGSITDIILPSLGIALLPSIAIILMLIPVSGIWYSIKRYKLMSLNPQNVLLGVLKTMADGVLVVNRNNIIVDTNEGASNLLGYREIELLNSDIGIIFEDIKQILLDDDYSSFELKLIRKDGTPIPVLFSLSTLKDEWGDKLGSVCIFQDISKIKTYQKKLKGAYDHLEKRVHERTIELRNANAELEREVVKRIKMEREIRKLALNDHLTGLPNRTFFNERLKKAILEAQENSFSLSVLFLDLDLFKMVNDTFGHTWGDELLKIVSSRLQLILRDFDIVARVGGDEFIILLSGPVDENYTKEVAEKVLEAIKQAFKFNNNEIYITASIGIAMYPTDGKDADSLIKNADIAMYKSKELGKNKYQFCDYFMKNSVYEEMKLTNYLYQALDRDELLLCYQPQVNTITGEIIGVEALIRWYHPQIGFISPKHFIPIAEKTGLIVAVGEWVLRTACRQKKEWLDKGILDVPIAVNLSVNQFVNNSIVSQIENILNETGINPSHLDIEVTERIFMKDSEYVIRTLEQLKCLGVTISIDDFGTEYSSLNYLKTLPLDKIKIAMEFVRGIGNNEKDEAIIKAMIILGKSLGLEVIAEGVETKEQLEFLEDNLCDGIQGYYFYRPMLGDDLEKIMSSSDSEMIVS